MLAPPRVGETALVAASDGAVTSNAPARAGLVLAALILVAAVANLNLAVANVALPTIGKAFDSSQTTLDLIAVGYSLGLAASVLYFGAIGDRYGRKLMLHRSAWRSRCRRACSPPGRPATRCCSSPGSSAACPPGMAYPTTLALITALWAGPGRTKSIALWSGIGGAISSLGPLVSGALLERLLVGLGLPAHAPARRRRARAGARARAEPRQRGDRARRQPRRRALGRARRGARPLRSTSRRCRTRAPWRSGWPRSPSPR